VSVVILSYFIKKKQRIPKGYSVKNIKKPQGDFMNKLSMFYSVPYTQKFLQAQYEEKNIPKAKQKSFENSFTFISYIDHGQMYLTEAEKSPIQIKPLLLFYGLVHLLKACVLTHDADYPSTSAVLAHGVSTRKKKKSNYEFLRDEIKLQKNGLFSHAAQTLFQKDFSDLNKVKMLDLFGNIPEIANMLHIKPEKEIELPNVLCYYLLLYNLSMIARYETEWWADLIKTLPSYDFVYIRSFCDLVTTKIVEEICEVFI